MRHSVSLPDATALTPVSQADRPRRRLSLLLRRRTGQYSHVLAFDASHLTHAVSFVAVRLTSVLAFVAVRLTLRRFSNAKAWQV
jgi:hypothetical protein